MSAGRGCFADKTITSPHFFSPTGNSASSDYAQTGNLFFASSSPQGMECVVKSDAVEGGGGGGGSRDEDEPEGVLVVEEGSQEVTEDEAMLYRADGKKVYPCHFCGKVRNLHLCSLLFSRVHRAVDRGSNPSIFDGPQENRGPRRGPMGDFEGGPQRYAECKTGEKTN